MAQPIDETAEQLRQCNLRRLGEDTLFVYHNAKRISQLNVKPTSLLRAFRPLKDMDGTEQKEYIIETKLKMSRMTTYFEQWLKYDVLTLSDTYGKDSLLEWKADVGELYHYVLTFEDEKYRPLVENLLFILERQPRKQWDSIPEKSVEATEKVAEKPSVKIVA